MIGIKTMENQKVIKVSEYLTNLAYFEKSFLPVFFSQGQGHHVLTIKIHYPYITLMKKWYHYPLQNYG